MKNLIYLLFLLITASGTGFSQVVKTETLSSGLLYPVCIQNCGIPNDNRLFIVEKRGKIKIVDRVSGAVTATPFLDIYSKVYPITSVNDERGFLGLAFHPNYASNGYFYVNYINTSGNSIIARYQVSSFPDTALTTSEQIIMTLYQPYANHNGGNLMFGPEDGYLYIAFGDGGNMGDPGNRAQNKDSLLGKILRVDVSNPAPPYYFSAPENPFYGATPGRDEIFDWGLRNPWRCSFDRLTHDLWMSDVGQNQYEEINFRSGCDTVGHNYGWRCYEGNTAYNTSGCQSQASYVSPVAVYSHSLGCSVTGGYVYRGAQEGGLFGKYLFTDYCQGRIWSTVPNGSGGWNTGQLLQVTPQVNNNFSSWGEDIDGELYLAAVSSGRIYRFRDTACAPVAYINAPETLFFCNGSQVTLNAIHGTGLNYNWTVLSGGAWTINSGQGTSALTLTPDQDSTATVMVTVSNGTCSSVSDSIVVIAHASFKGIDSLYCFFSPSVSLTGFPAGGFFSGTGISGNVFNPDVSPGTYTIQYTLADTSSACYYKASGCLLNETKTVVVSLCNGMEETNKLQQVKIYPNPGNAGFNVEFYAGEEAELNLVLRDALGKTLYAQVFKTEIGKQDIPVELSDIAEGVYFLTLSTKNSSFIEKLIISK